MQHFAGRDSGRHRALSLEYDEWLFSDRQAVSEAARRELDDAVGDCPDDGLGPREAVATASFHHLPNRSMDRGRLDPGGTDEDVCRCRVLEVLRGEQADQQSLSGRGVHTACRHQRRDQDEPPHDSDHQETSTIGQMM